MSCLGALEREIAAFDAQRSALAARQLGMYALVHGDSVVGTYSTEREAIDYGRTTFGYVPLLVERITREGETNRPANSAAVAGHASKTLSWQHSSGALHHYGPVAMVKIGPTEADRAAIIRGGGAAPSPIKGGALIDTGATFSNFDDEIIAELGLQPVGRIDVVGFDGAQSSRPRYEVRVDIEDGISVEIIAGGSQLRRPLDSPIPGYEALIGRDILAHAVLTYDGVDEQVTLQF